MRAIQKGTAPKSLVEYVAAGGKSYDGYQQKDELREHLVKEQRGLCCYCMSRIGTEIGKMKVEHWHSQDSYQSEQVEYSNLLAACMGNEGKPRRDQHCDTRKGNSELSRNPAITGHRVEELIRYEDSGMIASDDSGFNDESNNTLNLNIPFLVNNRKATLDGFKEALIRDQPKRGPWGAEKVQRELRKWNGASDAGELEPFCQIVVYWLRKRLSRARSVTD